MNTADLAQAAQLRDAVIPPARSAPIKARVARALASRMADQLPVRLVMPDGSWRGRYPHAPALILRRPTTFFNRLGADGLIGFGEAYQARDFDSDDLAELLTVLAGEWDQLLPKFLQGFRSLYGSALPSSQNNSADNAIRNISHHYDLSNDFFELFLDDTMTYSSGLFAGGDTAWENLADSQRYKIDRLLDQCRVGPNTRLLEIGSGWGELAVRAAARGATVDTITLSHQQRERVRKRANEEGVADQVNPQLRDYRDLTNEQPYDGIISVEMIEAVGEEYWPQFFSVLDRMLKPGGRIGLQAITMRHDLMMAARDAYTWIHKYIFPGGLIPSIPAINRELWRGTRLQMVDRHDFGSDYVHTLRLWRERFLAQRKKLPALGFDILFERTWEFYLAYSQAGFAGGHLDVNQFILEQRR